jgi:hypothetical protein
MSLSRTPETDFPTGRGTILAGDERIDFLAHTPWRINPTQKVAIKLKQLQRRD